MLKVDWMLYCFHAFYPWCSFLFSFLCLVLLLFFVLNCSCQIDFNDFCAEVTSQKFSHTHWQKQTRNREYQPVCKVVVFSPVSIVWKNICVWFSFCVSTLLKISWTILPNWSRFFYIAADFSSSSLDRFSRESFHRKTKAHKRKIARKKNAK